ncbi:MAG: hypothetical protein M3O36_21980 [Myxococcota bacterium]|nr:hypothetical protein [Myxococcota bacterium]
MSKATPSNLPPAPEPPRSVAYEFSEAHRNSFGALAASMSFVGVCCFLSGGLAAMFVVGELVAGLLPNALATVAIGAVDLAMAWWTVSAGRSLSALVGTRGRDVEHLMEAVQQLRRLFGFLRIVVIGLAVAIVGSAALVVWCMRVVERGGKCFSF